MPSATDQAIAQAALTGGPHAVIVADRDGIIRAWNETAERIFGHRAAEAIGCTLDLIVPEEERGDHWRAFRRAMATGVMNYRPDHILDVEGMRKDGVRVALDVALIAVRDPSGAITAVMAMMCETPGG